MTLKDFIKQSIKEVSARRFEVLILIRDYNEPLKQECNALTIYYDMLNSWLFVVERINKDFCIKVLSDMRDKYNAFLIQKSYLYNFNIEMLTNANRLLRGIENVI